PLAERAVMQQAQGSARPIHSWPGRPAEAVAGSFDSLLDRALQSENTPSRRGSAGTKSGQQTSEKDEPLPQTERCRPNVMFGRQIRIQEDFVVSNRDQG